MSTAGPAATKGVARVVETAGTRPPRSVSLGPWYRVVQSGMRWAYFGRIPIGGAALGPRRRPRLIIASHRNGAIDGGLVLAAFPFAQHLVSMQLLRGPLRAFFTGIPVIRSRDVDRYGMDRSQITDPVSAGVDHLTAGGDLVIFPEGTSEWRHAPGAYQRGAAKIWCRLREAGIDVDVVPVGLFYAAPERFASVAELWCGSAIDLPESSGGPRIEWEKQVHAILSEALGAVSVNCPDVATFNRVQQRATVRARAGESFAAAYHEEQAAVTPPAQSTVAEAAPPHPLPRRLGLFLHWLFAPVLLVAWIAGRKADARNTVSFFRMLGGSAAAVIWVLVLLAASIGATAAGAGTLAGALAGTILGAGIVCAAAGRVLLRARRWHPDTEPLDLEAHSPDPIPTPDPIP